MDATAALERLRDISSQVRSAVIFDRGGNVLGSTIGDTERARSVAREANEVLVEAERRKPAAGRQELAQLEVALRAGSVFVVRDDARAIAATTPPEPTVGLVFYDLKSCLRELDEPATPKKKTRTTRGSAASAEKKTDAKP